MKRKIIKLSESQLKYILKESGSPLTNIGTGSPKFNMGDVVTAEGPSKIESPDIDVDPMTGDTYERTRYKDSLNRLCGVGTGFVGRGYIFGPDEDNIDLDID